MGQNFENRAAQAAKALQNMRSSMQTGSTNMLPQPNSLAGARVGTASPQQVPPQVNANRVNTQMQGLQQQGMGTAQAVNSAATNPQNNYAKGGTVSAPPTPDQIKTQMAQAKIDPSELDVYSKAMSSTPAASDQPKEALQTGDKTEQMLKDYGNSDYQNVRAKLTQQPQKYAQGGDVKESIKNLPLKDIIKMLATHPGLSGEGAAIDNSAMSDQSMATGGAVKKQANSAAGLLTTTGVYEQGGAVGTDSVANNSTGDEAETNLSGGNVNMRSGGDLEADSIVGYDNDGSPIVKNSDGSEQDGSINELLGRPKNASTLGTGATPNNSTAAATANTLGNSGTAMAKGGMDSPPPGSLSKEVADDIPAKLSEGEFVFSADVVRFFGLQKLNAMMEYARQELQEMEGQGNIRSPGDGKNPDQKATTGQFLQDKTPNMNTYDDQGGNGTSDEDDNVTGLLKECMGGDNYAAGGNVGKATPPQKDDGTGSVDVWDKKEKDYQENQVAKNGPKTGEVYAADLQGHQGETKMATGGGMAEEEFAKGGIVGSTMGSLTPKKNEGLIPSGIKLSTQGGAKGTGTEMYGLKKLSVHAKKGGLLASKMC